MMKSAFKVLIITAAMMWAAIYFLAEKIPPNSQTYTTMIVTERRIRAYWSEHGSLPHQLSDLPAAGRNLDGSTVDGWGRNLIYIPRFDEGAVTLCSYGQTAKPGSSDTLIIKFRVTPATTQNAKGP